MKKTISRALLVVKESYYEQMLVAKNQSQLTAIADRSSGLEREAQSHEQHVATLSKVESVLTERGISYDLVKISDLELASKFARADFVFAIGGDGTFLMASHFIKDGTPVLGINSAPITSFGHFCICDGSSFSAVLDKIDMGELKPIELLRLEVSIEGVVKPELALNEFLIAHREPAASSRYRISLRNQAERHVCSGLLVATPSGSTGFFRSEGGNVLAIDETNFGFIERAPFLRLGEQHQLRTGFLSRGESLEIVSEMEGGMVFVDGNHIKNAFERGARLVVRASEASLVAYVDPLCHSPYMKPKTSPMTQFLSGERIQPGPFALDVRQNRYGNCHAISSYREVLKHLNMPRPEVTQNGGKYYVKLPGYAELLVYNSIPDSAVAKTKDLYARLVLKALDDAKRREHPKMDAGGGAPPCLDLRYLTGLKSTSSKRGSSDDASPSETLKISDTNTDALVVTTKERLLWGSRLTSNHAYAVESIDKAKQNVTLVDTDGSVVTVSFRQFDRQVNNLDRVSHGAVVAAQQARCRLGCR